MDVLKWGSLAWHSTRTSTSSWARHIATQSCMTKSFLFASPCLMMAASLNTPPCWGRSLWRMCLWMRSSKIGRKQRESQLSHWTRLLLSNTWSKAARCLLAQYQLKLHEEHKNNPVTAEDIGFLQNPTGIFCKEEVCSWEIEPCSFWQPGTGKDNAKGVRLMHGFTIQHVRQPLTSPNWMTSAFFVPVGLLKALVGQMLWTWSWREHIAMLIAR